MVYVYSIQMQWTRVCCWEHVVSEQCMRKELMLTVTSILVLIVISLILLYLLIAIGYKL